MSLEFQKEKEKRVGLEKIAVIFPNLARHKLKIQEAKENKKSMQRFNIIKLLKTKDKKHI